MVIDRQKVDEVRQVLGTTTIAETVDAALDEVLAWPRGDVSRANRTRRRHRTE